MEISPDFSIIIMYLLVFITNALIFISLSVSVAGTFCRTVIRPGCDKQDKKCQLQTYENLPMLHLWTMIATFLQHPLPRALDNKGFDQITARRSRTPRINLESSFRKKESSGIRMRGSIIPIMRVHAPVKPPSTRVYRRDIFFRGRVRGLRSLSL
jgi:hypothetical protein